MRKGASEAALLGALAAMAGCTSILGIGGDFTVQGNGGSTSSSSGGGNGGATSDGGGTNSTGGGGSGGALPSGPITGHEVTRQLRPKDHTPVATTPTNFLTGSHVLEVRVQAANGDWTTYTPDDKGDDGTFEFDHVPPGPYFLHVDNFWARLNNRVDVDLDVYTTLRQDATDLDTDPVASFDLTGLAPWSDVASDGVGLYSPTVNAFGSLDSTSEGALGFGPGSTSIVGDLDWLTVTQYSLPVNQRATLADSLWITHTRVVGAEQYGVIIDAANPIMVDVPDMDGAVFDLTANLAQVVQDQSLKVNFDVPAFFALASDFRSDSTDQTLELFFHVAPLPLDIAGDVGSGVDLVAYYSPPNLSSLHTTFKFGNPFPTDPTNGWESEVNVTFGANVPFQLLNCTTASEGFAFAGLNLLPGDPLLNPGTPLQPQLGIATNAEIDGHSFDANQVTLKSLAPTITWGPPTKGTATFWGIKFREVLANDDGMGGCTTGLGPATLIHVAGDATSLTIPLGLLNPKSNYEFGIIGYHAVGTDFEKTPGRTSPPAPPYYFVNRISETFATPNH